MFASNKGSCTKRSVVRMMSWAVLRRDQYKWGGDNERERTCRRGYSQRGGCVLCVLCVNIKPVGLGALDWIA